MELVPLCQTVVVQEAEKLANIEEYLGKYGYVVQGATPTGETSSSTEKNPTGIRPSLSLKTLEL